MTELLKKTDELIEHIARLTKAVEAIGAQMQHQTKSVKRNGILNPQDCDFTKTNSEIAQEMGVSRERIRQLRNQAGAPSVATKHSVWHHSVRNKLVNWDLPNTALMQIYGVANNYAAAARPRDRRPVWNLYCNAVVRGDADSYHGAYYQEVEKVSGLRRNGLYQEVEKVSGLRRNGLLPIDNGEHTITLG